MVLLPAMLRVQGLEEPHMRMRDRELALRFFAMLRTSPYGFRTPVKAWLNAELRAHQHMPEGEAAKLRELFEVSVGVAWSVFGAGFCRAVKGRPQGFLASLVGGAERPEAAAGGQADAAAAAGGGGEINVAQWDTLMYSIGTRVAREGAAAAERMTGERAAAVRGESVVRVVRLDQAMELRVISLDNGYTYMYTG